jgi:hypothetical protein
MTATAVLAGAGIDKREVKRVQERTVNDRGKSASGPHEMNQWSLCLQVASSDGKAVLAAPSGF